MTSPQYLQGVTGRVVCVSCVLRSGPQVWWGYNIVILRHTESLINIIYSVWSLISVSTTSYRQHYTLPQLLLAAHAPKWLR